MAAYLFITHDLNLVQQVAHRIVVMKGGKIVVFSTWGWRQGETASRYTRADRRLADPVGKKWKAMQAKERSGRLDTRYCLEFLSRMVQHKSYSQTEGKRVLAGWMESRCAGQNSRSSSRRLRRGSINATAGCAQWRGKSLLFNSHIDTNPVTEG